MRIYLRLSYAYRGVLDVTPTELETLTRVLDKLVPAEEWYFGDAEIKCSDPAEARTAQIQFVPANVRVVPFAPIAEGA